MRVCDVCECVCVLQVKHHSRPLPGVQVQRVHGGERRTKERDIAGDNDIVESC